MDCSESGGRGCGGFGSKVSRDYLLGPAGILFAHAGYFGPDNEVTGEKRATTLLSDTSVHFLSSALALRNREIWSMGNQFYFYVF